MGIITLRLFTVKGHVGYRGEKRDLVSNVKDIFSGIFFIQRSFSEPFL